MSTFRVELGLVPSSGVFILGSSQLGSGTDLLGDGTGYEWTDVTEYVRENTLAHSVGAQAMQGPWWRCNVGELTVAFKNKDGRFDPTYLTGPYAAGGFTQLKSGVPIRVCEYGDDWEDCVWQGWTRDWPIGNSRLVNTDVTVTAYNGPAELTATDLGPLGVPVGAGEYAGERITRILDHHGWPVNKRDIDETAMGATMQATTHDKSAWDEMLLTADSDAGYLWVDRRNRVVFRRRQTMPIGPVYTYSGDPDTVTGWKYAAFHAADSIDDVYTHAKIARVDGELQVIGTDTDRPRTYTRTDLICEKDVDAERVAQWIIFQHAEPRIRARTLEVDILPTVDDEQLRANIARTEIGDRIRVAHPTPDGRILDRQALILGMSKRYGRGGRIFATMHLAAPPTDSSPFILGQSELGGTDVLTPF